MPPQPQTVAETPHSAILRSCSIIFEENIEKYSAIFRKDFTEIFNLLYAEITKVSEFINASGKNKPEYTFSLKRIISLGTILLVKAEFKHQHDLVSKERLIKHYKEHILKIEKLCSERESMFEVMQVSSPRYVANMCTKAAIIIDGEKENLRPDDERVYNLFFLVLIALNQVK